MKAELGYHIVPLLGTSVKIPIYGLRAIPNSIANRLPRGYAEQLWQVQIKNRISNGYIWINESKRLVVLH